MKLFECKTYGFKKTAPTTDREYFTVFVGCDGIGKAAEAAQAHFEEDGIEMDSIEVAQVKAPFIEKRY